MAAIQNTTVTYTSDISGKPGDRVSFDHNGRSFTIDLDPLEAKNLRSMIEAFERKMETYMEHARPAGRNAGISTSDVGASPAVVREWAAENGYEIPARGRIAGDILKAWHASQSQN